MPNTAEKFLITIAGPTAVGKTELSIKLAEKLRTEIISADSRQFFKELNIGTAKPTADDLARVPHHFINSHSISETYSAGDFERDVLKLLSELFERYDTVIMTGGSGFYVKAVIDGLDDLPSPLPGVREVLTSRLHDEGLAVLQKEVEDIDPDFAATAEISNPQRVVRALEVYQSSGIPISQYQNKKAKARPFNQILIGLDRDRQELYDRIDSRMDQMLNEGLVKEAEDWISFRKHHALQTVGYKEVFGFFDGEYDEKEMIRLLKQNSRRYAKRQLTWFRHQADFNWFHPDEMDEVLKFIEGITNGSGSNI